MVAATFAGALLLTGCGSDAKGLKPGADAARPGLLAPLNDGRTLNLRCAGRGSPTVLLESGFGADSGAWSRVQPDLRRITRVCAYDRAGYGFSEPGPQPRDGAAIARDLDEALRNAGIEGPFVVVGHSAGGLYGRIFAARRLPEVVGLVLVDPTIEALARDTSRDGLGGIRRRVQRCLAASEARPTPPLNDLQWAGCGVSDTAAKDVVARGLRPQTWITQLSELDTLFGRTSMQVLRARDLLGDIPTYVLTASETADQSPGPGDMGSMWTQGHLQIAGRSRLGFQQTIRSSHLVMKDRPDAVIAAVKEMVLAAREKRPPNPLPPNETDPLPDAIVLEDIFKAPNPFDRPLTPDAPN